MERAWVLESYSALVLSLLPISRVTLGKLFLVISQTTGGQPLTVRLTVRIRGVYSFQYSDWHLGNTQQMLASPSHPSHPPDAKELIIKTSTRTGIFAKQKILCEDRF